MNAAVLAVALALGQPPVTALAFTPDDAALVVASQAGVEVRGLVDPFLRKLAVELDQPLCLAFAPDGKTLAVGGGAPAERGVIELWSYPAGKRVATLQGHGDVVHGLAWLPDGKTLVSASADRTLRLWDVAAGKAVATWKGHSGPVLCLAVLDGGKTVASGSADQTIRVWNVADGKLLRSLDNHLGPVFDLQLRPRAAGEEAPETLASASGDGTLRIWQPGIGRMVRIVRIGTPVFALAWNRAGDRLAAAGKDGNLRIVDGESDTILHAISTPSAWLQALARAKKTDELRIGGQTGEALPGSWSPGKKL